MRARHARQRRDLAGMVHADLDHREIGVARHPRQRQRHAPVVVVAGLGRMGPALPAGHRAACPWSRSCPTEPVTATTAPAAARARRGPAPPAPCTSSTSKQRRISGTPRGCARPAPRRPPPPAPRPRNRARRAPRSAPRTDRRAPACGCRSKRPSPPIAGGAPARGRGGLGAVQSVMPPPVQRRHGDAGLFASSKGKTSSPTICPVRGPCRRSAAHRPGPAHRPRAGSPRRGRRPRRPGNPAITAARIAAGSSLRGLSSVTITISALPPPPAHERALGGSRSPPAPTIATSRPMTCGRSAASAVATRIGVWA